MIEVIGEETDLMQETGEFEEPPSDYALFEEKEVEWLITPEQFVDLWISVVFLLVGTWQIITILFLLTD